MEKTVWTPQFYGTLDYDFKVLLDADFAAAAIGIIIPKENQRRMNGMASDALERLNINWSNPYIFHEDTCFLKKIYFGSGRWLSADYKTVESLSAGKDMETIEYHSHNVDTSGQSIALMKLFSDWIGYADSLIR